MPIRRATAADVPRIIGLLRGGSLDGGAHDDDSAPLAPAYLEAFAEIDANANQILVVVEEAGVVVGTLLLTTIRQIHHRGGRTAEIESVHVAADRRGAGIGAALVRWAIDEARRRGCFRVQLTSNKARRDAHRFYARLGFVASHEGMKLVL
jgi:GNAT superfamily N-acetyltransferase